MMVWWKTG